MRKVTWLSATSLSDSRTRHRCEAMQAAPFAMPPTPRGGTKGASPAAHAPSKGPSSSLLTACPPRASAARPFPHAVARAHPHLSIHSHQASGCRFSRCSRWCLRPSRPRSTSRRTSAATGSRAGRRARLPARRWASLRSRAVSGSWMRRRTRASRARRTCASTRSRARCPRWPRPRASPS